MNADAETRAPAGAWYLFLHQVPPQPAYFRARVLRRLNQLGALPIKNSAYVLPANDETLEDLQWLRQSIVKDGGEAWLFRSDAVAGHTDAGLREAFNGLRNDDYTAWIRDAHEVLGALRAQSPDSDSDAPARARRLQRQLSAIQSIDYFSAPAREEATALMEKIRQRIEDPGHDSASAVPGEFTGRRWVTRRGVKVDRIASAWLIRRFIDPAPEFVFVDPESYRHAPGEFRFDMFEGEFSHEGDLCTFEVLLRRQELRDPALESIAQIVHDIDLKEPVYRRPETAGVATMIDGIARRHESDQARLTAGFELFDALYAQFGH